VSVSDWLSYIGAVTGVSGAMMGLIAFRRSGKFKAIDLRLKLRNAQSTLQSDADELGPLLAHAKMSHERISAATGALNSGATKHWIVEQAQDAANLGELEAEVRAFQKDCSKLRHLALESELVSAHKLQRKIDTLKDKYRRSLDQDDKQRSELRQDQHK
jgi:hypothetical protein